jgi:16S rRNA (cytosine1402-N4)-methyltransferase
MLRALPRLTSMTAEPGHIPALLEETMAMLNPRPGEIAVDCTAGLGGHSCALAERLKPDGQVIGFDLDAANLARAAQRIEATGARFIPIHENFVRAPDHLKRLGLRADIALADLGFSSNQMDDPFRGFSFSDDGPLDMRLDASGRNTAVTAADLLAALSERDLADIIYRYGEEPLARKIARKLAQNRQAEPIRSTARLAGLVVEAYGPRARSSRMHPATRTFMALRIAVNDELGALQGLLDNIVQGAEQVERGGWLRAGARIAVISFHSLEDRLVKQAFVDLEQRGLAHRLNPRKKPITASEQEIQRNPRSRSAKLRALRIGNKEDEEVNG